MPLRDFVTLQRGHDLPDDQRHEGAVPIVGSFGITGWHDTARAKGPGVAIGRSGASFGVATYSHVDFWPLNTALYVIDFHGNDERFAYYFLKAFDFGGFNSGSAQPSLNRNFIHPVPVEIPPAREQREISRFLGALDDKIDLSRRVNQTLEAMAQALFKSWFVEFDPVRAKAEGRDLGLPPPIADLFPDRLVASEFGEIPEGWTAQSIYAAADIVYGAPFSSAQFNVKGIGTPLLRIRDLGSERPGVWTPEVHPKGYKVKPGDIVVGMDGEFRAYLWGGVEAWLNQRLCVFMPKRGYSAAFVMNSIIEPLAAVEATETGTTVIHLGKSDIDRFSIVRSSRPVLAAFNEICQPLYDRMIANKAERRTLESIRDAVLPRLLSGEIRVKDAEKPVGAVFAQA
jgi:type I restriction enzyme, S subunit